MLVKTDHHFCSSLVAVIFIYFLFKVDLLKSPFEVLNITRTLSQGLVGGKPFGLQSVKDGTLTPNQLLKAAERSLKSDRDEWEFTCEWEFS